MGHPAGCPSHELPGTEAVTALGRCGPWCDVMSPLLSSSDKKAEVTENERENLERKETSALVVVGEAENSVL